jgi:prevent-host-death family protein
MQVSIVNGKNAFAKLVHIAERGERVVVTRHGKPVAILRGIPPQPRTQEEEDADWLEDLMASVLPKLDFEF